MRQRDADPIPQAHFAAFRPSATPRPTGTLRIESYSATAILTHTGEYVKGAAHLGKHLTCLLKFFSTLCLLLTKNSHKKFKKSIDKGKKLCIIIGVSRRTARVLTTLSKGREVTAKWNCLNASNEY